MTEIASPTAGSSHHSPNRVFAARPTNTAPARMAHRTFCVPSPYVARDPSFSAMRCFASPRHGQMDVGVKRKQHSAELKARVAMASLSGEKTLAELSAEFGVHPTMISNWKQELVKREIAIGGWGYRSRPDGVEG